MCWGGSNNACCPPRIAARYLPPTAASSNRAQLAALKGEFATQLGLKLTEVQRIWGARGYAPDRTLWWLTGNPSALSFAVFDPGRPAPSHPETSVVYADLLDSRRVPSMSNEADRPGFELLIPRRTRGGGRGGSTPSRVAAEHNCAMAAVRRGPRRIGPPRSASRAQPSVKAILRLAVWDWRRITTGPCGILARVPWSNRPPSRQCRSKTWWSGSLGRWIDRVKSHFAVGGARVR